MATIVNEDCLQVLSTLGIAIYSASEAASEGRKKNGVVNEVR